MNISIEENDGYLLVTLRGQFNTSWAPPAAEKIFGRLRGPDPEEPIEKDCIIDLRGVDYMSSGALRILVSIHKKMDADGRKMVLIRPNDMVSELLTVSGLYHFFEIRPSLEAAAGLLSPTPPASGGE